MEINRPLRIAIGVLTAIATVVPVLVALAIVVFATLATLVPGFDSQMELADAETLLVWSLWISVAGMMCFSLVSVALQAFYVVHLVSNQSLLDNARILFGLGILFMPVVAMPLYYFLYIWKNEPREPDFGNLTPS